MAKRSLRRALLLFTLLFALLFAGASVAQTDAELRTLDLNLIYVFEGGQTEFVFAVGNSGFKSVDTLKDFLGRQPTGTTVRWAPGCVRFGDEPLLSSEADMSAFRTFLEDHGVRFELVPSG